MINTKEQLAPGATYHIYNRANGSEKVFLSSENYNYFIEKYKFYISPIAETFCYCLMPNHFHFLIRIRDEKNLIKFLSDKVSPSTLQGFKTLEGLPQNLPKLISLQFSHFFNCYTQAFNKQHQRKGSLLMHPYKRKKVTDKNYLLNLVHYIHFNPIESRLCNKLEDWNYSSYQKILSLEKGFLSSIEVINWFEDFQNFLVFHSTSPNKMNLISI
jgi:putative transposase